MRSINVNRTFLSSLTAWALAASACIVVEQDPQEPTVDPGHVEVSWAMGGRSCTEAAVATIGVRIANADGEVVAEASGACNDRRALMGPVEPGSYTLKLHGSSFDGVITHAGGLNDVVVAAGRTSEPDVINLAAVGATLKVSWKFANGDLCSFNEVDGMRSAIYDDLSREVHLMDYACDPDGPIRIPDVPAGAVDVFATGLDIANKPLFRDQERVETSFGIETEVRLVLEDCELRTDGC